jgi:hypothetical protein
MRELVEAVVASMLADVARVEVLRRRGSSVLAASSERVMERMDWATARVSLLL